MAKKGAVKYAVVDAFAIAPFKGNPAAVCYLEEQQEVDEGWMQSVAKEFNLPITAFLTPVPTAADSQSPRFHLRWFTTVAEVDLCGHATLASVHFLLTSGLAKCEMIEFVTRSGILTAKVHRLKQLCSSKLSYNGQERFSIELDFPVILVVECDSMEIPSIPGTLNGIPMVNVQKTATAGDLIVELASGRDVADIKPKFDELRKCIGRGVIITGPAPPGSGYDFFTRFFCPKLGVNEDFVCGSVHCALAPYWSRKLGKHKLVAYMASPRGGKLDLLWEKDTQRVRIRGEAITVMEGFLLV